MNNRKHFDDLLQSIFELNFRKIKFCGTKLLFVNTSDCFSYIVFNESVYYEKIPRMLKIAYLIVIYYYI